MRATGRAPTLESAAYALDNVGNRLTDTAAGMPQAGTATYTYDALDRLATAAYPGSGSRAWGYDAVGNRTSVTAGGVTKYAAYDNANRLCWDGGAAAGACASPTSGATTYVNDNAGNRTSKTAGGVTTTYAYDGANRLKSVTTGGTTTASYTYDGDGYRVGKTVGSTTSTYTWDRLGAGGLGTVIADGSGENVFGPAGLQQRTVGSASQFAQGDGLGSIRLITDGSGNPAGGATYAPFGAPQAGSAGLGGFGFTGEQTDAETGFVYLRARTYDPASGRFVQQDSYLGEPDDPATHNLFAYVRNNPVRLTDPSGHDAFTGFEAGDGTNIRAACHAAGYPTEYCTEFSTDDIAGALSDRGGTLIDPTDPESVMRDGAWLDWLICFGTTLTPGGGAAKGFSHAWIKRSLFTELAKLVGQADFKKFVAALGKGVVGPRGESGIKVLTAPVGKYTHELKIGGSAQRLLGYIDENGVLIFDKFVRGGLH